MSDSKPYYHIWLKGRRGTTQQIWAEMFADGETGKPIPTLKVDVLQPGEETLTFAELAVRYPAPILPEVK